LLTKDLLDVKKRRPNIKPNYRNPNKYKDVSRKVLNSFVEGRSRGEIYSKIESLENHDNFRLVRGLKKIIERDSDFGKSFTVNPEKVRKILYQKGFVTSDEERMEKLKEVSSNLGVSVESLEEDFWADREINEVLKNSYDVAPKEVLKQYNLSLTQTLLFDAVKLSINVSGNYKEIFRAIKYYGLMYEVDEELNIKITGPASIIKKTRKYGTSFAKLLPYIMASEEWKINADIETEVSGEKRIYNFELNSNSISKGLFPDLKTSSPDYDSEVERRFASRLSAVKENWEILREPTILKSGNSVMIPDFCIKRLDRAIYLEIVGFWTPEYLKNKCEKIRKIGDEKTLIVAVDASLGCGKEDFEGVEEVIFYDKEMPLKPLVKRMESIEKDAIEERAESIGDGILDLPTESIFSLEKISKEVNTDVEVIAEKLKKESSGLILPESGMFIPEKKAKKIREEIMELEDASLGEVEKVLKKYKVSEEILDKIGFDVIWKSFKRENVEVVPKPKNK